jgi:hypothetical protein
MRYVLIICGLVGPPMPTRLPCSRCAPTGALPWDPQHAGLLARARSPHDRRRGARGHQGLTLRVPGLVVVADLQGFRESAQNMV